MEKTNKERELAKINDRLTILESIRQFNKRFEAMDQKDDYNRYNRINIY
jgi:hypothetical protein